MADPRSDSPVGKYGTTVYGREIQNIDQAAQAENEQAIIRQRENLEAYHHDVVGSGKAAMRDASTPRNRFLARVYNAVSQDEFNRQASTLSEKFNVGAGQLRGPLSKFDIPLSVTQGLAMDLGRAGGVVQEAYAEVGTDVLGKDSPAFKALNTVDTLSSAVKDDIVENLTASPWMRKRIDYLKMKAMDPNGQEAKRDVGTFLSEMNKIWSNKWRTNLGDLAEILEEWYYDPRTLCCFIKNMAALASSGFNSKQIFSGEVHLDPAARELLDKFIAILKIVRAFLNEEVGFDFMLNIDLGLMMTKASVSGVAAALMALETTLEDTLFYELMKYVNSNINSEIAQCLPFERFFRLLAHALIGPEGLLKFLEDYINSFFNDISIGVYAGYDASKKGKMIDLAAIDKLIDLITAIRDALFNLELCVEANFSETSTLSDDARNFVRPIPYDVTGRDLNRLLEESNRGSNQSQGIVFPTDTEVRAFIMNRMGGSKEFADQVVAKSSRSSEVGGIAMGGSTIGGTKASDIAALQASLGDCAKTLNPERIMELSKLLSSWDITL